MPRDKPFPRWVRALWEIFRPARTIGGVGRLGLGVLGLLGVGVLVWKQTLIDWSVADPYRMPFVAAVVLFLLAYFATYSLLREKDESSNVRAFVRVLKFEIRDSLPVRKADFSTNQVFIGGSLVVSDALIMHFEILFHNDGDETRVKLSDLTLKPNKIHFELPSVAAKNKEDWNSNPETIRWPGEMKIEIPARNDKKVAFAAIVSLEGGDLETYKKKLRSAQIHAKIFGQPDEILTIARPD